MLFRSRGGSTVPGRVQRGSLLFAEVALGVVVVVIRGVLDAGLGVNAGLRSSASARVATRAASRRSGGGACRPASETLSARIGHCGVEIEDAPQPPTWRAKCRGTVPRNRKGIGKGLNTESNNPQRATATVLVGFGEGQHCRDEHTVLPRFRALWER